MSLLLLTELKNRVSQTQIGKIMLRQCVDILLAFKVIWFTPTQRIRFYSRPLIEENYRIMYL